jgi:hypothetical protein
MKLSCLLLAIENILDNLDLTSQILFLIKKVCRLGRKQAISFLARLKFLGKCLIYSIELTLIEIPKVFSSDSAFPGIPEFELGSHFEHVVDSSIIHN